MREGSNPPRRETDLRRPVTTFALIFAGTMLTPAPDAAARKRVPIPPPPLELVESTPVESGLDHADIRDAHEIWLEMIGGAKESLDIEQFYVSNAPSSRLEAVLVAIEKAARRGVRVRVLADRSFYDRNYPESLDRLAERKGIEVRLWDAKATLGGVQHAKVILVDSEQVFIGSQNFDWRSLEHNVELGVRVVDPTVVEACQTVFDADWAWAAGEEPIPQPAEPAWSERFPVQLSYGEGTVEVTPAFSPAGWLPDEGSWDLPALTGLIDSAETTVRVQLLSYKTTDREGRYFEELESALRRAAARKVEVRLMVADWSKRRWSIEGLQSLQALPGIQVKLVTIPQHSGGYIPYARVIHSKFLVADDRSSWLGTGNWSRDYFHGSRNYGLFVDGAPFAARLIPLFDELWESEYAETVDPGAEYEAPRFGE